jgi:hypothetical protein
MNLKRLAPILLISISLSFVMPIANAGTGTLSGITYAVGGVTPLANVPVVAYNTATGDVMWDYIVLSAINGAWTMALPTGTYAIIATTPNQDIVNTDSDMYPTVTVADNGVITLSGAAATGRTPTTFNLTLKTPRWTGTIKSPAGTLMEWAHICITDSVQSYRSCSYSDSLGRWALGAPSNVTIYHQDAWVQYLTTEESPTQWPERRFNNKIEIEAGAMGAFPVGVTKTGIQLAFAYPNFTVVVKAGGTVVANAWAQLSQGENWIGWQRTDQNGYAGWTDADLTETSTVAVQVGGTTVSQTYAATSKTFTSAVVVANAAAHAGVFTADIALDSPNLFGVLRQPTVAGTPGAVVSYGNIELRAVGDYGAPLSFENTDSLGLFSLNIPKPTAGADLAYTMTVGPRWNSLLSSSRTMYDVTVSTANAVTVKLSGTTITATNTAIAPYALALSAPSVSGEVVDPAGAPKADSYVIPINHATGEWLGQYGANSKSNGTFGISLADGTYDMQALKPWNSSNLSNSALCAITVAGGVITTVAAANTCVPTTNTLKLALRTPNLTMTLKDSAGAAVAFARVGLQVGNWYTNEISGSDGTIGLNIDRTAILAINGAMADTTTVNVYVDPPWGTSTVIGWRCQSGDNKAVCKTSSAANDGGIGAFNVNTANQTFALGNIVFAAPNTTIHINTPNVTPPAGATWTQNTSVGAGAWVWLNVSGNSAANAIGWIGASTDANGDVKFDIDSGVRADASTRFRVEIYPPWNGAVGLSQKTYDSQVLAAIEAAGGLALNSPNTFITVNVPVTNAPTIWGWIGVEEVNATTNAFVAWQGGYGLNQIGKVALTLSASKRYKITAYPNKTGANLGTVTSCYINTSETTSVTTVTNLCPAVASIGVNNDFTLTLSAGNVTGTVTRASNSTPVANATVYATSTTGTETVTTTTSATGTYALNLNNNLSWNIDILPYNATGATALAAVTRRTPTLTGAFGATTWSPSLL